MRHFRLCLTFSVGLLLISADISYAAAIRISWNANSESDLDGYKVYYGTSPGQYVNTLDVGNITSYPITGLTAGVRYYIALTAYDTSGNESARSAEVSAQAADTSSTTSTGSVGTTTTTMPRTTTSALTTSLPPSSTSSITTSVPATTTIRPTTSTTAPAGTTTSSIAEELPCEEAQQLFPLSIEASSEFPRFFPKGNLIDGDPHTAWSTILSLFRPDASITLDLGGPKYITSLSMYAASLFGIDFLPSTIQVQTSTDNTSWKTITNLSGYTSLQPPYADSWMIGGQECRYLKVILSGRKGFFFLQLAQIAELEVYGCERAVNPAARSGDTGIDRTKGQEEVTGTHRLHLGPQRQETGAPSTPGKPVVHFSY